MQEELKKVEVEVFEKQKQAVLEDIAVRKLHLAFTEQELEKKEKEDGVDKEELARQRLQQVTPLKDSIKTKTAYYEYLCNIQKQT